jgi:gamma-glutamyltranspeptidase / glutathione hydrolase
MADWFATIKVPSTAAGHGDDPNSQSSSKNDDDNSVDVNKDDYDDLPFRSRRSPVLCRNGCVASGQPLASSIGLDLLRKGANAAEAAIAVAAALCVTEPCSTGLGGDMFCLHFDASTRKVCAINGSGRSPAGLTLDVLKRDFPSDNIDNNDGHSHGVNLDEFRFSAHAVTVPGAAKGYEDLLQRHGSGKFTLAQLLEPAAKLAEEGFPVAPVTSHHWRSGMGQIQKWLNDGDPVPLTVDGVNAPQTGELIKNPDMARVLRELGEKGSSAGFYEGRAGQAIVDAVQKHGGTIKMDDLKHHTSTFPDPIFAKFRNVRLWQVPPNGQGIAGLIALKGLGYLEKKGICPNLKPGTADTYHSMIEMMRLGFADARAEVTDEEFMKDGRVQDFLLDTGRIERRAEELFDLNKAAIAGTPLPSSCTVSFQVVDGEGNAISFVNSNFMGFGTGIVPDGCGFTLQNRGFGFSIEPGHPNVIEPNKRPYHTIIPGMMTFSDNDELYATISNMGGNMQPQGHMQLTINMVAGGMDPQSAIDFPRFCIAAGTQDGEVFLEDGVAESELEDLRRRGQNLRTNIRSHGRSLMGRAQIIKRDRVTGVLWAGSDGRADGCAMGF